MMMRAMVFGCTGQDGSYLSELLLSKDYEVVGIKRRSSTDNNWRLFRAIEHPKFKLLEGDLTDATCVANLVADYTPNEIYNMAAQSHVHTSFEQPHYTFEVNTIGVLNILEAIRRFDRTAKFLQASTSEMFGNNYSRDEDGDMMQDENTEFKPCSPYAISKVAAHELVQLYRDAYSLYASSAISFNHESERRGEMFVTRKITTYVARLKWALDHGMVMPKLELGNLAASRDWAHAKDYCRAFHLILQRNFPDDYVIATGQTHTVADFCELAFKEIGIKDWKNYVTISKKYFRPKDVSYLCGNSKFARRVLDWEPQISFEQLVRYMVLHDIERLEKHGS